MKNRNEIGAYLNGLGLLGEGVEVGVWKGDYSTTLLSSWRGRKLWLVDPWAAFPKYGQMSQFTQAEWDAVFQECMARVAPFGDRVQAIRMPSVEAAKTFQDGSLDFVYIDADHGYTAALADCRAWYPKVKVGGFFSGHDFWNAKKDIELNGVEKAVTEFAAELGVKINLIPDGRALRSWWWRKA